MSSLAVCIVLNFKIARSIHNILLLQVHIFCVVRERPGGRDGKERLKKALQSFKILPQTNDRQQMTEEERYVDYGFEHRVTFVKGTCLSPKVKSTFPIECRKFCRIVMILIYFAL